MKKLHTVFNTGYSVILIIAWMLLLSACFSPWAGDGDAAFTLNLGGGNSGRQTVNYPWQSQEELKQLKFTVSFESRGAVTETFTAEGTNIIQGRIAAGTYNVTVEITQVSDGSPYAWGTNRSVRLNRGNNSFGVHIFRGDGSGYFIPINQTITEPGTYVLRYDGVFVLQSSVTPADIANVKEINLSELILVGGGGGGNGGDRDQGPNNVPHAYTFNGVTYTWPGKGGSSYIFVNGNNLYEAEGGNPGGRGGNILQPGAGGTGYRNGIGRHGGNGWGAPDGAGGAEYQTTGSYPDLYKAIHPGNGGSAAGFNGMARGGSGYGGGGAGAEAGIVEDNHFSAGYAGMGWGNSPSSQPLAGGTRDTGAGGGGGSGYFTENSAIAINGITTFRIIVGAGGNGAGHGAVSGFHGNGAAGGGSGYARIVGTIVVGR